MSESPESRKKVDQRVGQFVLIDELPGGSLARVFRARYRPQPGDPPLALSADEIVVLKVLRDAAIRDPRQVNAFTREAELLSMVDHPGIVRGLTRGVTAGRIWTALEYVEGCSLDTLLQVARNERVRLRPEVALVIVLDVLAGLAAAQAMVDPRGRPVGFLHRNVTPGNVLLDHTGQSRLGDFSSVLLSIREEPTGAVIGTPGYMAPEQARGEQLTQGVDVYAVGLMLFELMTSRRAFDVDNLPDAGVLAAHADNARASWPDGVDVPLDVRQLVDQATADSPEERPADAAALYTLVEGLCVDPDGARARLSLVVRDILTTDPDRPPPLLGL